MIGLELSQNSLGGLPVTAHWGGLFSGLWMWNVSPFFHGIQCLLYGKMDQQEMCRSGAESRKMNERKLRELAQVSSNGFGDTGDKSNTPHLTPSEGRRVLVR